MTKITSRKFLISIAAFLASIGSGITGIVTDNNTLTYIGLTCTIVSAAIYAACEAYVDGQSVSSNTTPATTTTVVKKEDV